MTKNRQQVRLAQPSRSRRCLVKRAFRRTVQYVWLQTALTALLIMPSQAQELLAWPLAANQAMRVLWPGMPIRPIPLPQPIPRPIPRPLPLPRPTPVPVPTPPPALPLTVSGYRVEGTVQDNVANLTFHITFHNPTPQRLEGVLIVPIPSETVLSGFSMNVAGKEMKAELLEADKASSIYQEIVNRSRDPGLLELVGERMLRAKVFPIEPNGDIVARISLSQILHKSGDLYSLSIPMKSARMLSGTTGRASLRLELASAKPLRTLYSPVSEVKIERAGDRHATVSFEAETPASDLPLFFSFQENPLGAGLLTFKEEGEDGFFLLSLAPKLEADPKDILPKDVVFVVDRSGSMEEEGKMDQARKALSWCISRLGDKDRFGIVDFATDSSQLEARLLPATKENKARALRYVQRLEATGGTNIEAGLSDGLSLLKPAPGRLPLLFFMTDGLPTVGQTDVQQLLKKASESNQALRARLFSFGVGADVNTLFLDTLAQNNRGARDYVLPGETIENKVSTLYQKVAKPALTDVKLEWRGVETEQVYPRPVTDLFYGSELVLMGRYHGSGRGTLVVTGRAGAKEARFEFPLALPREAGRHAFLPRLWANMKVTHELDAIRLSGRADPEVVKDIVKLAKRYGIVTPYTSFLITEEGRDMANANAAMERNIAAVRADAVSSGFSGRALQSLRAQKASRLFGAVRGAGGAWDAAAPKSFAPAAAPAMESAFRDAEVQAREELKEAGKKGARTRSIGGKTFYERDGGWVDGDEEAKDKKDESSIRTIAYLSREYFELLRRHPGLARYLSLGANVTVSWQGLTYKIVEESR